MCLWQTRSAEACLPAGSVSESQKGCLDQSQHILHANEGVCLHTLPINGDLGLHPSLLCLFISSGSGPSAGPGGEIASSLACMEMVAGSSTGHRGLCQQMSGVNCLKQSCTYRSGTVSNNHCVVFSRCP